MSKRFIIAWFAVFVLWMLGSFAVHGTLLHDDYGKLPNLFRPETEAQQYFPLMLLAHVVMAGAFVWIYAPGAEPKPWFGQGLRYGLAVVLLTVVPTYTIYFAVQPIPGGTVVKQIVFDGILIVLLALVVAFLYRPKEAR
jgi:hypothetical protein